MAVGRRPQPQERAFGGEVVGVANAALAVFLILAFHSYRAGDAQANQMGLVGYMLADLLCPTLGRACYLFPSSCSPCLSRLSWRFATRAAQWRRRADGSAGFSPCIYARG